MRGCEVQVVPIYWEVGENSLAMLDFALARPERLACKALRNEEGTVNVLLLELAEGFYRRCGFHCCGDNFFACIFNFDV